ncbi:MAG: sulfatase-like hydrolase/transferase [Phycisphaeraceae bacterium]|nr:sulfatase-like hydrolase/transferase [Phycisphaeraceae bacterium]
MGDRPNILVILSDQQRWDTLGCYGRPPMPFSITPHLDAMAKRGVRFELTFTAQPVCGPSRACLQTGMYATQTGNWRNNRSLPVDQPTVAKLLGAAGYETAYVGKWHLAADDDHRELRTGPTPPERRGGYTDYWVAADTLEFTSHATEGYFFDKDGQRIDWQGYRVDRTVDFALEYLRDYARRRRGREREARPFFLFVSVIEPHHQNDENRYVGPEGSAEKYARFTPPSDLVHAEMEGDWRSQYPDYLGCCASLDENVGRVIATLRELGLDDDTLKVYTSDHGCTFRTRPPEGSEYKRSCYESAIRVPMVIEGPGFLGGGSVNEVCSLIDLPATLLRAGNVPVPNFFRGRPLQDMLTMEGIDWPQEVFLQISESQVGRVIRTRWWKYAVAAPPEVNPWNSPRSDLYVESHLYDLRLDPDERHNLVRDPRYAGARAELAQILLRRMAHAGEPAARIVPAGEAL